MRIVFALPSYEPRPNGGFKIVYEYANRLARRGHTVSVIHPWSSGGARQPLMNRVKRRRFYPLARRGVSWFVFDDGVDYRLVSRLEPSVLPEADALVATAWRTAEPVAAAAAERGTGFYLVQNYETFDGPADLVDATWRLPLHKIVIARWLERLSEDFGEGSRTSYVPNAIDPKEFFATVPQRERRQTVGMLWHHWSIKRAQLGLKALELARASVPGLRAVFFGTAREPDGLPHWATYTRNPSRAQIRKLYNSMAVFLHPSAREGWPLPPAEAMACGCAIVAAANDGVLEYANDQNALLAPLDDAETLALHVIELLTDAERRERLAEAGVTTMRNYSWDRAIHRFEGVLDRARRTTNPRSAGLRRRSDAPPAGR